MKPEDFNKEIDDEHILVRSNCKTSPEWDRVKQSNEFKDQNKNGELF